MPETSIIEQKTFGEDFLSKEERGVFVFLQVQAKEQPSRVDNDAMK